jgi:O-antigen ligase
LTRGVASQGTLVAKGCLYLVVGLLGLRCLPTWSSAQVPKLPALFLLYALFSWATVTYSADPAVTAYTGFGLASIGLGCYWLATQGRVAAMQAPSSLCLAISALLVISLLILMLAPGLVVATRVAGSGRIAGVFGSPNGFGAAAAVACLLAVACFLFPELRTKPRWLYVACAGVAICALVLSGSRTAQLALITGCSALAFTAWPGRTAAAAIAGSTLTAVLVLFGFGASAISSILQLLSRTGDGRDVLTLTGRLPIWEFATSAWLREPWLGYGLGASRNLISTGWADRWGNTVESAHNAVLESLLNVGLVGTLLLFVCIAWALLRISKRTFSRSAESPAAHAVAAGLMVLSLAQGVTEKAFAGTPSLATGAIAIAIALLHHGRHRGST